MENGVIYLVLWLTICFVAWKVYWHGFLKK